jgi:hypothetical protein
MKVFGFAVVPCKNRLQWQYWPATHDGKELKCHDLAGSNGSWTPSKTAIFIIGEDQSTQLCSVAENRAGDLVATLNNIKARGE